jgi:hypothetical protein
MYRNIYTPPMQLHASHLEDPSSTTHSGYHHHHHQHLSSLRRARKLSFLNLNVLRGMDFNYTIYTIRSWESTNDILDTLDVAASPEPVESDVSKDVDEADERHDVRDASTS